jgi:energy-coupling factor transport system permease protein
MKALAATIAAVVLVASLDPVTPSVLLGLTVLALPVTGVDVRVVLRRSWPLALSALSVGLINAFFGTTDSGRVLLDAGPLDLTTGSALTGLSIALRVVAIGLPGIVVVAATDPVDLADSLVQQLHVPTRFAYGTLAALRLLPLLAAEWESISRARRARGLDSGGNPVRAVRLFCSQVFALLVVAIRRATRLATAMDARGFDAAVTRTRARTQHVVAADWALVATATLAAGLAVCLSLLTGSWEGLL